MVKLAGHVYTDPYQFVVFENLIVPDLEGLCEIISLCPDEIEQWKKTIMGETRRVRLALQSAVCDLADPLRIEIYMQHHQTALIRLIDVLNKLSHESEYPSIQSPVGQQLCGFVIAHLMTMFEFMTVTFYNYLDKNCKVPNQYRDSAMPKLNDKVNTLKVTCLKKAEDRRLVEVFMSIVDHFLNQGPSESCSLHQIRYFDNILQILQGAFDCTTQGNQFKKQLFQIDFNHEVVFDCFIKTMEERMERTKSTSDILELLALEIRWINQIHLRPGFNLHPGEISLKNRYSDWITGEMSFLEKKQQLTFTPRQGIGEGVSKDFKVKTTFSVPQLAYFVKILVETGIIKNKNQTEIITFFSKSFATPYAENISPGSLRSKFYYVEESACSAVKDILISLLNYVRRNGSFKT